MRHGDPTNKYTQILNNMLRICPDNQVSYCTTLAMCLRLGANVSGASESRGLSHERSSGARRWTGKGGEFLVLLDGMKLRLSSVTAETVLLYRNGVDCLILLSGMNVALLQGTALWKPFVDRWKKGSLWKCRSPSSGALPVSIFQVKTGKVLSR